MNWIRRKRSGSVAALSRRHPSDASLVQTTNNTTPSASAQNHDSGALGLQIIHEPDTEPVADIIFIHGLGGHCYKTWSHNHNPEFFWPGLWLPKDPKIARARLFTYGYNSQVTGPEGVENIADFARSLLFDMQHSRGDQVDRLGIGDAPIIFVAHSLGGLVVKKAYLLAQLDEKYQNLSTSISGIIFLSTPHRGSNLANILSLILRAGLQPKKKFIQELVPGSATIEDINAQFCHVAPKLSIFSFYEQLETLVARTTSFQIVAKDSAIMGYKEEEPCPLRADHHTVCKFTSEADLNYRIVRDTIKDLLEKVGKPIFKSPLRHSLKVAEEIKKLLALSRTPIEDLDTLWGRWVSGTCTWITNDRAIQRWFEDLSTSHLVWYHAPPASGKSILSSYMIHHLQSNGHDCQYHFFNFGDQSRKSIGGMLKSLAYQISSVVPGYGEEILAAASEDLRLDKGDHQLLWQKLFGPLLSRKISSQPLFWVIDGIDESESPETVMKLLGDLLSKSKTPIKVFVTGRHLEALALRFKKMQSYVNADVIDGEAQTHNNKDIELLINKEIEYLPGNTALKGQLHQDILHRAAGNFLWVRLVLEDLQTCQTEREIRTTLEEIPEDMTKMYERMEQAIVKPSTDQNKKPSMTDTTIDRRMKMAKSILQWVVCVPRPLTVDELKQALVTDYDDIIDMKRTIRDVCGQFTVIDSTDHVIMVHQTARDFLTKASTSPIAVNRQSVNSSLLIKTLSVFSGSDQPQTSLDSTKWMPVRKDPKAIPSFTLYAAHSWIYHLDYADPVSDKVLDSLETFFTAKHVLDWIHVLASYNQVRTLARAGKALLVFVSANRKLNSSRNPMLHRLSIVDLLESWAGDLVRITAKFNAHLVTQPNAIYDIVPAMCPPTSAINGKFKGSKLVLHGQSDSWNDIFARLSLSQDEVAMKIVSVGPHIAVLTYGGRVYIWSSIDFGQLCVLRHGEAVTNMSMNTKGDILVTYGLKITTVWDIPGGSIRMQVPNGCSSRTLSLSFVMSDEKIVTVNDDRSIRVLNLVEDDSAWESIELSLTEKGLPPSIIINSPSYMAIDPSGTQIGVCYRSFPLTVWDLKSVSVIRRCMSPSATLGSPETWSPVETFAWNPITGHIIGWYKGNKLFKWHPLTEETHEVAASVDELAVSPNGKVFVTSDSNGTVKVWNFIHFTPIYQLSSGDLVSGLSFSPDSTRFYDIRGPTITAWEPNGLIRLAEAEETFSDAGSDNQRGTMISHLSEANAPQYSALSALAAASDGLYHATGNEDGEVYLHDVTTVSRVELTRFYNFQPVTHLAWSADSRLVVAADLATNIQIIQRGEAIPEQLRLVELKRLPSPKVDLASQAIHEIIVDPSSRQILVISNGFAQTWDIIECSLINSVPLDHADQRSWLNHPTDHKLFIGVGPEDIEIRQWSSLRQVYLFKFNSQNFSVIRQMSTFSECPTSADQTKSLQISAKFKAQRIVRRVLSTQDGLHILVHLEEILPREKVQKRSMIITNEALDVPTEDSDSRSQSVNCQHISDGLARMIEFPLGILPGDQMVFLDRDLWLCSINLTQQADLDSIKRHYFIPRDWTTNEGLRKCCILRDGTLLCPQDGNVVTIKSNLRRLGEGRID